jgi:hypothetical protein
VIAAGLQDAAWRQIEVARSGKPLAYRDAEQHPAEMVVAPANNLGAIYRVAYWSAVAARIALAQGTDPSPLFQLATSSKVSATAASSLGSASLGLFATMGLTYSPSGTDSIDKILLKLERLAGQLGVEEVASTMWLQRRVSAQDTQREVAAPTFTIPWFGTMAVFNRQAQIALGVIAAAVVLWFARPVLVPVGRFVGGQIAAGAARRRERRTRRHAN